MTELPFEILRLISQFLEKPDLLQFQLINKRWHEASSESLYSQVTIGGHLKSLTYIETISNSQRLGSYLKTITVNDLFSVRYNVGKWDIYNLLNTLVKYCYNLRTINVSSPHYILWTRLMHVGMQGKFPNLQELPWFEDEHIESYVCTALAFRKSLTTLHLIDHISPLKPMMNIINFRAFQELRDSISEFQNLQNLIIQHSTCEPFSVIVDSIIDDCPKLIELYVTLRRSHSLSSVKGAVLAIPKPNIRKLACDWFNIYKDDQLKYIMRKFPNLQHLHIQRDYEIPFTSFLLYDYDTSYDVMMEFIRYISSINKLYVKFECQRKYVPDYWRELIKLRKTASSEQLCIKYESGGDSSFVSMFYSGYLTTLTYSVDNADNVIPHEELLREHGDIIKKLSIDNTFVAYKNLDSTSPLRYVFNNENWIHEILRLCPSLQELKLSDLAELNLPANNTYQHKELKKLEVMDEKENITSLRFLKTLSSNVPNLKELKIFSYQVINTKKGYCIEIEMPYTTFDLIEVKFNQTADVIENYLIKLNTIYEEKYYRITSTGRRNLTHHTYQKSNKRCVFEITCRGMKKFELIRNNIDVTSEVISRQIF